MLKEIIWILKKVRNIRKKYDERDHLDFEESKKYKKKR
jgi:hypothetical protein